MKPIFLVSLFFSLISYGQTKDSSRKTSRIFEPEETGKHKMTMSDYSPSFDKAHSNAKQLLKEEFYFSPIDESGPFGNDDGSDTYAGLYDWRQNNKTNDPIEFLLAQLTRWGYPPFDFYETDFEKLKPYLKQNAIVMRYPIGHPTQFEPTHHPITKHITLPNHL